MDEKSFQEISPMSISSTIHTPGRDVEGNAYEICHLTVQRARQLQKGTSSLVPTGFQKPTSKALEELAAGKVRAYTAEEWAEEEERRAEEVPAPLDEVLEIERPVAPEVLEDVGGFSGFLNAVMTAGGGGRKRSAATGEDEDPDDDVGEDLDEVVGDEEGLNGDVDD
jgi:DNA-directed RNA polymerase omega subunit